MQPAHWNGMGDPLMGAPLITEYYVQSLEILEHLWPCIDK